MEVIRYKYIFIIIACVANIVSNEEIVSNKTTSNDNKSNKTTNHKETCPFSKIIEDVFKLNKSNGNTQINNSERAKLFLHSIANITSKKDDVSQAKLVDDIIAAINRIKNNITLESKSETKLNEAIILNPENKDDTNSKVKIKIFTQIKSGIEEKTDINQNNTTKKQASNNITETRSTTTEKTNYVEILTIEPNNTHKNNVSSNNIIEVLKHLMPMFNTTAIKELHNITIIEKNINRNHSYSTTKNVSTIIVTYCDKDNSTKPNVTLESDQNAVSGVDEEYDYYGENYDSDENDEDNPDNMSEGDKREILEAAEYGMQKMHELYSVLEPKLYSMGFWLDNTNPARYVAAFNAPSEDSTRFTRYGYASLQAATKLKELIRSVVDDSAEVVSRYKSSY